MSFLASLLNALPGAVAQGLIWGLMAIGVYITFRILDVADLTVDGSLATGGAVAVMLIRAGLNAWAALLCAFLAGMLAGFVTGLFHTKCGIPAILAGILTQLSLYSINLRIMGSKYDLLVSQRYVRSVSLDNPLPLLVVFTVVLIAVLYWFFGTEKGCSLRATGANPNMARAQGINTNANVVLGLMVSNGLVALSGGLLAQFQGSSDINMGRGAIVIGQLRFEAAGGLHRCRHLLHRSANRFAVGSEHQRSEAGVRPDRGRVPGDPLLEGPHPHQEGRFRPCLS